MYKIGLSGIKITAPIGVYEWEKEKGRKYTVDVELFLSRDLSAINDKLNETVNYEDIYDLITEAAEQPINLVETFAESIGKRILQKYSKIEKVRVRIEKERPMPRSNLEYIFIESEFVR